MNSSNVFYCLLAALFSVASTLTAIAGGISSAVQANDPSAKRISAVQEHCHLSPRQPQLATTYTACSQDLQLINQCIGGSRGECQGTVRAYIYGILPGSGAVVFVGPESQFHEPERVAAEISQDSIAISIPQGDRVTVHIPGCLNSGRIAFIANDDRLHFTGSKAGLVQPSESNMADASANSQWSFMEFTTSPVQGLTVNPSQVDFASIPVALALEQPDAGSSPLVTGGMKADAVASICEKLTEQTKADGLPWDQLCIRGPEKGGHVRALSPNAFIEGVNQTAFSDYWKPYVDEVWEQYRGQDLVFDVAMDGTHACRVQADDQLHCVNGSISIPKPSTKDIFSCASGPFAHSDNRLRDGITARLCAAFVRSTIHTGQVQPCDRLGPKQYYQRAPTNYFAKFVHEASRNGQGYAFAFDWVSQPSAAVQNFAHGQWTMNPPGRLTVTIGGWR